MTKSAYFICPACGRSFKVASWYSMRIFCGRHCREYDRKVAR